MSWQLFVARCCRSECFEIFMTQLSHTNFTGALWFKPHAGQSLKLQLIQETASSSELYTIRYSIISNDIFKHSSPPYKVHLQAATNVVKFAGHSCVTCVL